MIKAIIFDLGGVIIYHHRDVVKRLVSGAFDISEEKASELWHKYKHALLTGEMPSREFLEKGREETRKDVPLDVLMGRWKTLYEKEAKKVNMVLLNTIRLLRKSTSVYVLTDTVEIHHEINTKRGLYNYFTGVYCSHLEGKSKSQGKEVFEHFLIKFNLNAKECVFIDDMDTYVNVAKSLGMKGIVFTDNASLFRSLKALGISV